MANKYIRHGATYNGDGLSSAVASGSTVTFTIASPGKVNWTGHGLAANALVYFGVTTGGALPTGITAGTTYYVRNPGTNDFEVSATSGGASINFSGTPSGTASCTTTGAWNHIDITLGTAVNTITGGTQGGGSIAANDVVYIRSKTEAAANITITISANVNFGSSSATSGNPINWIFDNGSIWSGVDGTLTFDYSSSGYSVTLLAYNRLFSQTQDAIKFYAPAVPSATHLVKLNAASEVHKCLIDTTRVTAYGAWLNYLDTGAAACSCHFVTTQWYEGCITVAQYCLARLIDPDIELLAVGSSALISIGYYGASLEIFGGQVRGAGATTGVKLVICTGANSRIRAYGFKYPPEVELIYQKPTYDGAYRLSGTDGGFGVQIGGTFGMWSSRQDGYFPTLNATYPDSDSTPWSWKAYLDGASGSRHGLLPLVKAYTAAAAAKTVTLEVLVGTSYSTVNTDTLWMEVIYIDDATGSPKRVSTREIPGATVPSSSASWSSTTYGAVNFDKRKLSVTTPTSIKQDTFVYATLFCNAVTSSAAHLLFVCPDVQLS